MHVQQNNKQNSMEEELEKAARKELSTHAIMASGMFGGEKEPLYYREQMISMFVKGFEWCQSEIFSWFESVHPHKRLRPSENISGSLNNLKNSINMDKKRIYVSGPISGHDLEERRQAFKQAQVMLEAQGWSVINPMENGLPAEATTHEHMKRDINMLLSCDAIYMLCRWTHSKGCMVEFHVATAIGLDVYFEESGTMIKFS